jgi:rhodanese-related sulfurtransferase
VPAARADQVSASQALELLDSGAMLLDVREQHEWDAGHAPQAQLLPMSELAGRVAELPTDVPIVCICHVGSRSAAVAAALNRAGWQAINLTGGMLAWQAAGLPIVDQTGAPGYVD